VHVEQSPEGDYVVVPFERISEWLAETANQWVPCGLLNVLAWLGIVAPVIRSGEIEFPLDPNLVASIYDRMFEKKIEFVTIGHRPLSN
jgi:hypothetical protein